jgi:hypothetical protein
VLPAVLLVLFPVLLMVNTKLAFAALLVAIVLLYNGRTSSIKRRTRLPDDF